MTVIERLEKKYGIKVVDDSFFDPLSGRYVKRYKMYSADGCPWENGLTIKGLQAECREWGKALLEIKASVEELKAGVKEIRGGAR